MKIVSISDTHGILPDSKNVPSGDVFIHCGDIGPDFNNSFRDAEAQYQWAKEHLADWLKSIDCEHKIIVPGNHDFWLQYFFDRVLEDFSIYNLSILVDDFVKINGQMFYGSPWTYWPGKYPKDWAYGLQDKAQLEQFWDMIFPDVDVLITHSPPLGVLDLGLDKIDNKPLSMGCGSLRNKLATGHFKNLKLHLFGHIHEHGGKSFTSSQNHVSYNCSNSIVTFEI